MAIFGRRSARQRLRSAARESLAIPAFSAPVDCSAWVLGGLWPAELATITPETAPLADYLNADLQRIAHSANEKLHAIRRSDLTGQARQTAEARVINVARAFAVLRVESTVRQLHKEALEFRTEYLSLDAAPRPVEPVEQVPPAPPSPPSPPEPEEFDAPEPPRQSANRPAGRARHRMPEPDVAEPPLDLPTPSTPTPAPAEVAPPPPVPEVLPGPPAPPPPVPEAAEVFDVVEPAPAVAPFRPDPLVIDSVEDEPPTAAFPAEPVARPAGPPVAPPVEPVVRAEEPFVAPEPVALPLAEAQEDLTAVIPAAPEPAPEPAAAPSPPPPPPLAAVTESSEQRLQRLLAFVARQEPALRWAIGTFADGTTLLVTDIAHGWIPSGIELPAGVRLLEPGRRAGTATAMLGTPTESASYSPGDRLGWASDFGATDASVQPRELAPIDDLGWQLSDATHWRDGLPRMANTLAKAGSAGTGVVDAEIDLLRVHLDTMRYQLLAQYPDADTAVVLNCMLLAATEGIATGDTVSANYHYSWFRALSAPPAGQWDPQN